MYWIAAVVILGFAVLLVLAGKQEAPPGTSPLMKPFYKAAMYLYKKSGRRVRRILTSSRVEADLRLLYPAESRECPKTEYCVKKTAVSLAVILAGTLFGAAAEFSEGKELIMSGDGVISRGNYREGIREISVVADYGQRQMDFLLKVEPVLLSEEEASALFDEFLKKLPEYISGENDSLENVTSDLKLQKSYGDYPITVRWESSRPWILSDTGQVRRVEQAEQVILSLRLDYGEYGREEEINVILMPPAYTEEEQLHMDMEEMLRQSQEDSLHREEWILPREWRGERISWSREAEDNGILIWGSSVAAAVAIFLLSDRDLHEKLKKRKKCLHREYPEIVHKLALFVGAGMTVRGAFRKIAGDYETKLKKRGKLSPACEEILHTCREQDSGVSESVSYERFGRRVGLQEYVRLSTLLSQNLKKGTGTLPDRLREEADKAGEEKLQQGRKAGEEAGTKLLVPMVMMLAVVMVIIMIPAFVNM